MRSDAPKGAALWLIAISLATLFTAFQIQSSFFSGALSLPVTYDDVGYFNDALMRLEVLAHQGGRAFLSTFWVTPPHSPLSTTLAILGFALLGPHPWAADAMNAIPLAGLLRVFLGYANERMNMAVAATLAAALLGFPMFGVLVVEFRPDMLCALAAAVGVMVMVVDPAWRSGALRIQAMVAILFALALLAKPTLAPVTIAVFGMAAISQLLLRPRSEQRLVLKAVVLSAGAGILVTLPYYTAAASRIYHYVFTNAFGDKASVWQLHMPVKEKALYYLWGPGGSLSIGRPWLLVAALLLVVCAVTLWRHHKRTSLSGLVVALFAYLAVTVPAHMSPFIGMIVPALVGATAATLAIMAWGWLRPAAGLIAALMLFAFSAATWRPVMQRLAGAPVPELQARHYQRIHEEVVGVVASIPNIDQMQVFFPVIGSHLNPDNVELGIRQRYMTPPKMPGIYLSTTMEELRAYRQRSQVLVLLPDDTKLALPWPPTTAMLSKINAEVDASGEFEELRKVDTGIYGGPVRIMVRKP